MTKYFFKAIILAVICAAMLACTKANTTQTSNNDDLRTYKMKFAGRVEGFDGLKISSNTDTKSPQLESWKDGDILYIYFTEYYNVYGQAFYDIESNNWTINMRNGGDQLNPGNNGKCKVFYFENPRYIEDWGGVQLSPQSIVYEDSTAVYSINENREILVSAVLRPKTARIKFTGDSSYEYAQLAGLTTYSYLEPYNGSLQKANNTIDIFYNRSEEESYVYGFFTTEHKRLYVRSGIFDRSPEGNINAPVGYNEIVDGYTLYCEEKNIEIGKSGDIKLPNQNNNYSWRKGLHFIYQGIEFSAYSIFQNSYSFLGETEVTEDLYSTINGKPSTSQFPQTNISRSQVEQFLVLLREKLQLPISFEIPYNWDYPDISNNDGQSNIYEEAWCAENCSGVQVVRSKNPNTQGFYDLFGNVAEWVNYWNESQQVYEYRAFGGSYKTSGSDINNGYCVPANDPDYKAEDLGFRLRVTF